MAGHSGRCGLVRNLLARRVFALWVWQEEGACAHRAGHDHPPRRHLRPLRSLWLWKNNASLLHSRQTGMLCYREILKPGYDVAPSVL